MSKNKRIVSPSTEVEGMIDEMSGEYEDIADEDDDASLKSYGIKTTNRVTYLVASN